MGFLRELRESDIYVLSETPSIQRALDRLFPGNDLKSTPFREKVASGNPYETSSKMAISDSFEHKYHLFRGHKCPFLDTFMTFTVPSGHF